MEALQPELPPAFASTRAALHRVAEQLVAPARKPHNEIALRQTPGGFGTPQFEFAGETMQVRVEGSDLVLACGEAAQRIALTSLAHAGAQLGDALLPDGVPDDTTPLDVDPDSAERLADVYTFADGVLRRFRESLPAADGASGINLWPEHFDLAFEAGSEEAGKRANYGASPGDADHSEPYLYVGPWTAPVGGELWNATAFTGAELGYSELARADDQVGTALEFFASRRRALSG